MKGRKGEGKMVVLICCVCVCVLERGACLRLGWIGSVSCGGVGWGERSVFY